MDNKTFHLGLCMAGSVSAGAYTAGVVDYLMQALEKWNEAKASDPTLPDHRVEIDLLGGSSGGGMTAAMAFFAFRDNVEHASLEEDGRTIGVDPDKNIFWNAWVELTGGDVFDELLNTDDIADYHIPSALNATFIDRVATRFEEYVRNMKGAKSSFLSNDAELFMTLFNVTGMKYQLNSRAIAATEQYVSEHRDLAHFKWGDRYEDQGRIEISLQSLDNLPALIQASKATGAFPVGLKARVLERKAKYIWDNPFFQKNNKFGRGTIDLGSGVTKDDHIYTSLNADGGTSNNEPVELVRDLMLQIRLQEDKDVGELERVNAMDDTQKMIAKSELSNYSIILVDPFPSYDFDIVAPKQNSTHIFSYGLDLVLAMNSQLQFDAKEAIDAYDKGNYGLHIIAPSRGEAERPEYAIACGALGGFGGFFSREYRIHDYFLGRRNCQSFLRKYFVVDPNEKEMEDGKLNQNYQCVSAVIEGYHKSALERFGFTDENGKKWIPIIPDVTLTKPIEVKKVNIHEEVKNVEYEEPGKLPLYKMNLPPNDFLEKYHGKLTKRTNILMKNIYDSNWLGDFIIKIAAAKMDNKVADTVIEKIKKDLLKRKLIMP